jgi:hypothetical protein
MWEKEQQGLKDYGEAKDPNEYVKGKDDEVNMNTF